jgi:phosphotransferase system  glucose/maltose/N-acetylglucosamine-specific IIC component
MKYTNSPYGVYNGMISGYRNMFLSSTVAIALIGFSQKFKNPRMKFLVSIIGAILFFLALFIAYLTISDMDNYLQHHEDDLPEYIDTDLWKKTYYIGYIYGLILILLGTGYLIRMFFGRIPFI